jgi:hypothetical protein
MAQDGMSHAAPADSGTLIGVPESEDSFKAVPLLPRYTPDRQPFEKFYVPLLSRAVQYHRAVGYWSAAELMYASQGVAHFLSRGGKMQLIVGAQLHPGDVDAVLHGAPLNDVVASRLLADPELAGAKIVKDQHLAVLAWMVKTGTLEIRVGVPKQGDRLLTYAESGRYFHTKYGVFTDTHGNKVAFTGSNNATIPGWSKNHETFDVQPSWHKAVWDWNGVATVGDFDRHWNEHPDEGWAIIPLPLAVREHLLSNAPDAPPLPPPPDGDQPEVDKSAAWADLVSLAAAPAAGDYTAVGTAAVEPLPHQARLVQRVVESYPRGYVFADEVGLGKTIEVGLVLRELVLSRRVKRALVLVPASVLGQWQEELHDKMSLDVPRYTGTSFEDRHGQPIDVPAGSNPWSAFPIVLASSHLARRKSRRQQLLDAGPWDVVVVDEAHHARRRGSKPNSTPNSLLLILMEMRDRDLWRALYLASATPMQMNAHEAWDLIALLGLHGRWAQSARDFLGYFERLRTDPGERDWTTLSRMLADYFSDPKAERDRDLEKKIMDDLGWVSSYTILGLDQTPIPRETAQGLSPSAARWADAWLRRHTPMRDRVFRNTRQTMRLYQQAGIIADDVIIPYRHVNDVFIPLADNERKLYERIEDYIRRHYNTYTAAKADKATQALGFIMTVYRRRLTSSFEAIRCSLRRRLDVLEQGKSLGEMLLTDDELDVESALFDPEEFDVTADLLRDEIGELRSFLAELDKITGEDTKATQLVSDIRDSLSTYASVVVFTQYTDTLDYVRERLVTADYQSIGCYSGRGGEVYDPATKTWVPITKADLKVRFRNDQLTILLGTDSMSEGLNLQTSGRLINYDMPWNLMRVEQRIGRIDRIGAAYPNLQVTNYFYLDTVEQRVYEGIAEDFTDFTDIVGNAQPVLGDIEKRIEQLALTDVANRDAEADKVVEGIRNDIADLANQPIGANDLGDAPATTEEVQRPPVLVGAVTLDELQNRLTVNTLTRTLLEPVVGQPGQYRLSTPATSGPDISFDYEISPSGPQDLPACNGSTLLVTFDRDMAEAAGDDGPVLLTYGSRALASLLPAPEHKT